jgi:hypothetical protein
MVKRLTIAMVMTLAMFCTAVRLPAQACAMSMPTGQRMPCGDCCAKMKSCALPQKDQRPPATAASVTQESTALIAPAVPADFVYAPLPSATFGPRSAESLCDSAPRLAILCTFLI